MQLSIELKGIKEALEKFDPKIVRKSAQKALNRAAKSGKTVISSQIREKFNIKKSDLDRKIDVKPSKLEDLEARLTVTGKPISLMYFGARQTKKGVSVKILKVNKRGILKRAFIATGRNANVLVFSRIPGTQMKSAPFSKRLGRQWKREKLRVRRTITYVSILKQPTNLQAVENRIMEQLEKEMASSLKYLGEKE